MLDVAAWGTGDILALPWLTPPPAYQVAEAGRLLHLLGATDDDGRITAYAFEANAYADKGFVVDGKLKASWLNASGATALTPSGIS